MAATKTVTKAVTKAVAKSAPKAAPKAKTLTGLAAFIVEGVAKRLADPSYTFYKNAVDYHTGKKTVFPRSDAYKSLTQADAERVFEMHDKRILTSGSGLGKAVFDCYMVNR